MEHNNIVFNNRILFNKNAIMKKQHKNLMLFIIWMHLMLQFKLHDTHTPAHQRSMHECYVFKIDQNQHLRLNSARKHVQILDTWNRGNI